MKNTKAEIKRMMDDDRKKLLEMAGRAGVGIVHIFNPDAPKGGLTVAFRKHLPEYTSTNMVEVAVVTCSAVDNFSRKVGTTMVLSNFFNDRTIDLPLSTGYADEDLNAIIKQKFTELYGF